MPDQTVNRRYSLERQAKFLVNSAKFSDVSFLVGEKRVLVRGHKAILALGSEIFEKMLFGSMKMPTDRPIEITDLTPTGFLNVVRYIYGHRVEEFDLADFYVSYLAADKYASSEPATSPLSTEPLEVNRRFFNPNTQISRLRNDREHVRLRQREAERPELLYNLRSGWCVE